jgi:hypothetical protein
VSKIRQALNYEQALADAKLHAARDLLALATEYEHKLGVAKFDEIEAVQAAHSIFHEREHVLYGDALEKASSTLQTNLLTLQTEVDRLSDASKAYMTTERFEREHAQLFERVEAAFARVDEQIGAEARVTVGQTARDEVMSQVQANRRWMIGLAGTTVVSILTLALKLLGVF